MSLLEIQDCPLHNFANDCFQSCTSSNSVVLIPTDFTNKKHLLSFNYLEKNTAPYLLATFMRSFPHGQKDWSFSTHFRNISGIDFADDQFEAVCFGNVRDAYRNHTRKLTGLKESIKSSFIYSPHVSCERCKFVQCK